MEITFQFTKITSITTSLHIIITLRIRISLFESQRKDSKYNIKSKKYLPLSYF